VATVGGMRRFRICQIWQKWQVQMNHAILAFMFGHQNQGAMSDFVAKIILCLISLWAARMILSRLSGMGMILCMPWESFHHSLPESRKNLVQYHIKVAYSESERLEGCTISSNHCRTQSNLSSSLIALSDLGMLS
jgi:hypothetical protein